MAKKINKEILFDNYFDTAVEVFSTFETVFNVDGVWSKIIGVDEKEQHGFSDYKVKQSAQDHVRSSGAWQQLSSLYDYAVDGIASQHPVDIVTGGAVVLSFIRTENESPALEWEQIIAKGDGRLALDDGNFILLDKLALLADVDTRTVRNAISAGELIAEKTDGGLFIENTSARNWLSGRRGFKPTVMLNSKVEELNSISTPAEFGIFLTALRKKLGLDGNESKLLVFHPNVDARAIMEIEQGVFKLPIDTVFPIADFYQLDRKELLSCVMRVFFSEQLSVLRESIKA